ncbi:4-hydroxy-tetrahydrodipicolinate synthase [Demequina muriae]|uniref:4-hydroxy-tetrahydrodipicolinate synthase n=1 Tax=Demequina muriae TaxID=3051664 RepID=A0ABT8GDQ8_9MICO|nr:4-hydroxy-tetrahydrodipicolinate synthase [Demequina sp. EGI L300058]MDN4479561.1 4-hydroxy-tetrahydrodipicolinate synthase [Demequina sp. EGI L300058]
MNDPRPLGTVLTAMVTPMHADGTIDIDSTIVLANHLLDHGSDGLVISGTTGEAPTTHAPEKLELTRALVDAVGHRATLIAGAGSNDTAHAVMMAEQATEAGVDGVLALVPYYSKPSQKGVVAHLRAIAGATDLPVMLYDIPGRTGIALSDGSLDELAEVANIVANKDATADVAAAKDRIARTGLAWYSGDDPLTLEFMRAGAAGVVSVSAHVAGERIAAMIAAHDAGDTGLADSLHDALLPVHDAIFNGPGASNAKAAMQLLGVIPSRHMRLPLLPLDDDELDALAAALRAAGVPLTP